MLEKLKPKIKKRIKPIKPLWKVWLTLKKFKCNVRYLKFLILIKYLRLIKKIKILFKLNKNFKEINQNTQKAKDPIILVCAADENFVMPLTVMLKSLIVNLKDNRRIKIYILEGGIKDCSKNKILDSVKSNKKAEIKFISVNNDQLKNVKVSEHISLASYYRLIIPYLLPKTIKKAIYLDSDLIVNEDLSKLWNLDLGKNYLLAVQEQDKNYQYVAFVLRNYKKLGDPKCKYFNAGVLVINLDKWRLENIGLKTIKYIKENRRHIRFWDQDGLNAILANKWGELDLRWNLLTQIFFNKSWKESPCKNKKEFKELISNPYIIHFNTHLKPWQKDCKHPYKYLFYKYLDMINRIK